MHSSAATQTDAPRTLPWYVAVLHGLGGLFAGGFLISFFFVTLLGDLSPPAFGVTGAILIGGATAVAWFQSHSFVRLFALSFSLAGHAALGSYFEESFEFDGLVAGMVPLSVGLYALYRDSLHRFLSVLGTLVLVAAWILEGETVDPNAVHGILLLVSAATVWSFGAAVPGYVRPAGYAAMIVMLALPLLTLSHGDIDWSAARIVAVLFALAVLWLLRRAYPTFKGVSFAAAAVGAVAVGAVTTPGLGLAAGVLVIGFWRGERLMTALGLLFLPLFLVVFYYDLELSLLQKSFMLMAGGTLMLCLRQALVLWDRIRNSVGIMS